MKPSRSLDLLDASSSDGGLLETCHEILAGRAIGVMAEFLQPAPEAGSKVQTRRREACQG